MELPYLSETQVNSYREFLQKDVPHEERAIQGLERAFRKVFPIVSTNGQVEIRYKGYKLMDPPFDVRECKERGLTYRAQVRASLDIAFLEKEKPRGDRVRATREIKGEEVFMGEIPLMTETGSFIINGTERVIVSQLHRSPGVYFEHDGGRTTASRGLIYSARVIPYFGSWLDFEFDAKDSVFFRIDKRRKLPVTILLKALGYSVEQILDAFYEHETFRLGGNENKVEMKIVGSQLRDLSIPFDLLDKKGNVIIRRDQRIKAVDIKKLNSANIEWHEVPESFLLERRLAHNVVDQETGELFAEINQELTEDMISRLRRAGIEEIRTLHFHDLHCGPFISQTLMLEPCADRDRALTEIYRMLRPGDPPNETVVKAAFDNTFFNPERYSLSEVGRLKFNQRLKRERLDGETVLSEKDILDVVKTLVALRNGQEEVDDIDNLGNRRVRSVGELVQIQYIAGLQRIEKAIKDRMGIAESEGLMPHDLINAKAVTTMVRDFIGSSQLSQFMDQTNPLSEITHKRRVSALGPGGLVRERAGFEVRDVHPTHYGRVCPIETPEGPNIGLINSMALYARTNRHGFLETSYRKVRNRRVTSEIENLSAIDEAGCVIAQADSLIDQHGRFVNELVSCRERGEFKLLPAEDVTHMDVSPAQIASVAAALIPFLEHDDANRALMGSNMQRQAVPCLRPEKPLVGTGIETKVAKDSMTVVEAGRSGTVDFVDSSRIVIKADEEERGGEEFGVNIYNLTHYERSNQDTSITQRPIVKIGERVKRGDIIADGASTDLGELALGQNLLVAFLPWNGYNFEDSIMLSERVVEEGRFSSVHIKEFVIHAREDSQLGTEQITRDIPNKGEAALAHLDASGIISVGTQVSPGDILVGKVTPKSQTLPSSEEKLLRAIFGEKAANVKDTSMRLPSGASGVVTDVKVFTAEGVKRDTRAQSIIDKDLENYRKDLDDILRIVENDAFDRLRRLLMGTKAASAPKSSGIAKGSKITAQHLDSMKREDWIKVSTANLEVNDQIAEIRKSLERKRSDSEKMFDSKRKKLTRGDELPQNVLKTVKVYVAIKRNIQPGDKMSGRHGNKGVVSRIVPVEDMPYQKDGTTVDIVLNPLGVPSRMNVGQILEAHLGLAAKGLGKRLGEALAKERTRQLKEIRTLLANIYRSSNKKDSIDWNAYADETVIEIARSLKSGVPFATPIFDGATEDEIRYMLKLAGQPTSGQMILHDGRTGEPFARPVTVGYVYMLKLHHLADEKMHARSTGPYSMVTQQPLGGKAQQGGQRLGEMEVWALEAYGAAYTLCEMLTVKSDDIQGRAKMFNNIVEGKHDLETSMPESFSVLMREIRALGLNFDYLSDQSRAARMFRTGIDGDRSENFSGFRIGIASPETIRSWSHGEVRKPETINYRSTKPERDGLFCAKIFGPIEDFECLCGKYKGIKHRGVMCTKCGVEVTKARVRRERMGHIDLACPIAHIWFIKSLPSRVGLILDMTLRDIERILYYECHTVVEPGSTPLKRGQLLVREDYDKYRREYGKEFSAGIGAEGLRELLRTIDLDYESETIHEEFSSTTSVTKKKRLHKRLKLIDGFRKSGERPEWMILEVLPVLPPDLRPLVPIPERGRYTTSDLNDLYRRVINRNNRLRRLIELKAPDVIVDNEKRMLQEAVDSLLDNGRRGKAATGINKRPLKSLADIVKGKSGRFRQNLLGKRVDFSGRSVIVVGPNLKLHQCGLPKKMALELFKPFVFNRLATLGLATNIKNAKRLVDDEDPAVWDILEEVIRQHPVLLNRAPTLHRLGIQAFEPVLIDGKAIQLHPLVCVAFNADFDGDQMAVHVPLSIEAQTEARVLMLSSNNVLSSANGDPIIVPTQDIVLGLYFMTREDASATGAGSVYTDPDEVERAIAEGCLSLHAPIKTVITECSLGENGARGTERRTCTETTAGRALLSRLLPDGLPFSLINRPLKKRDITDLVNASFRRCGLRETVIFVDHLVKTGFKHSTTAGISICLDDMVIPESKTKIITDAENETKRIQREFESGILSEDERYNKAIDLWDRAGNQITSAMMENLSKDTIQDTKGKNVQQDSFNSIFMMADSGARGSQTQIKQLAGMRGLMAKPDGRIIETPVTANFREGLNVHQYFISTHGARKGLADTALKTSNSGYLTRRLVDVSQDLVITEEDCGTQEGITLRPVVKGGEIVVPLKERILGRLVAGDIAHPRSGQKFKDAGSYIDEDLAEEISKLGINELKVRSAITCKTRHGLCAKCYGRDLGRGGIVNLGEAVGVIAAQSIGEPGTQLTMRTFHIGGAASRSAGEREIRSKIGGIVHFIGIRTVENRDGGQIVVSRGGEISIRDEAIGNERERYMVQYGASLLVKDREKVDGGTVMVSQDPLASPIVSEYDGIVHYENIEPGVNLQTQTDELTGMTTMFLTDAKRSGTGKKAKPVRIVLTDASGKYIMIPGTKNPVSFQLQPGTVLHVKNGQKITAGDIVAKTPQSMAKSSDITGGLPRVAELFEARSAKNPGILSLADGRVAFKGQIRAKERIMVIDDKGVEHEHQIPKDIPLLVQDGQTIRKGSRLTDGETDPKDILDLLGIEELVRHIVDNVQDVYRLQGVTINDKHIEVIVHQMLRRVEVTHAGDSTYVKQDQIDHTTVLEINEELVKEKQKPIEYKPIVLGISKASLSTESFISAASFQETTRVLTEAAVATRVDHLRGLKENVIIGRLIPAGTGFVHYERERKREAEDFDLPPDEKFMMEEELASPVAAETNDGQFERKV